MPEVTNEALDAAAVGPAGRRAAERLRGLLATSGALPCRDTGLSRDEDRVADVGTKSRRPGPAAEPEPSLLDLSPAERAMVIRLGTAAGKFDETGTAKAAKGHAAMVADATRQGAWTTSEDTTPGRRVDTRGVAGYTAGQNYGR